MTKFILFAGEKWEAGGGMEDYCGSYYTLEEARSAAWALCDKPDPDGRLFHWWHIADVRTMEVVASQGR